MLISPILSCGLLWWLVGDWRFAVGVWLGVRVFALWVNMVQNYWTHDRRFGTRRYDDPGDNAMNIGDWLPVMATFSACWQNNHHHHCHLLRTTHHPAEFDFGHLTVRAMGALGLVKPSKTGTDKPDDLALAELALRRLLARERRGELGEETCRDRSIDQAVALRPGILRQIVSPEQSIDEGPMDGKVDIGGFWVRRVVPMMVAHCHEVGFQQDRARTKVRVTERGVERDEDQIPRHRVLRKSTEGHRDEDQAACKENVDEVGARAGDPVHGLDGVMDGVKAPQKGDLMERAVRGVLSKVRDHDGKR